MRGVYRLDDSLASEISEDAYRQFIETKIRLIPKRLIRDLGIRSDHGEISRPVVRRVKRPQARQRAAAFFHLHPYFSNAISGNESITETSADGSQNFLEVEFVKKILAPALSERGLKLVHPQEQVGSYLVDFALCGTSKFAFEVDGFGKFKQPADLDNFIKRQNYIAAQGWRVIRYTYSQIMTTTETTLRNFSAILAQDPQLGYLLAAAPDFSQAELFNETIDDEIETLLDEVNDFHRIQDLFADFCATHRPHETNVVVRDSIPKASHFVAAAIAGLYDWLDAVAGVLNIDFDLPNVVICGPSDKKRTLQYGPHTKVHVTQDRDDCDLVVDQAVLLYGAPTVPAPLDADARRIKFRHGLSIEGIHSRLRYFTEHVFGYPGGTKPFQDRVLQRVFNGRDVLGISTTGSGKSFCFWLPALLRPGLTIVVAPLRSLMRDQLHSLRKNGIAAVEFINVDVPEVSRQRIIEEVRLGYIRLLYVAPERLRIKEFIDQLADITPYVPINLLAIDEAHCISEWGHDFRPSYLKLPFVRDSLSRDEYPLRLVALTATAGRKVEADMIGILKLQGKGDDSDVIREAAADRVKFSYQMVIADKGDAKTRLFHDLLNVDTPKALTTNRLSSLLATANPAGEKAVGIVFCIYADPHGKYSTKEGTAHYLYEAMSVLEKSEMFDSGRRRIKNYRLDAYSTGRVRAFSSKKPTLCPYCHSYDYSSKNGLVAEDNIDQEETASNDGGTGLKTCRNCRRDFNDSAKISPPIWDKVIKQNQEDFKATQFDILVATKGFGMGIDQRSVRFVVHTALSSGLESWYQEVGRAGRDNERAHIALLAEAPNSACRSSMDNSAKANREIRIPDCNYSSGCPHGKTGLCDYGKQHMFIKKSYPGEEFDALRALAMLDRIFQAKQLEMTEWVTVRSGHDRIASDELAIHRLNVLGLVQDYQISYKSRPHFLIKFDLGQVPDTQERLTACRKVMQQHIRNYLQHFDGGGIARSTITRKFEECQKAYKKLDDEKFKKHIARLEVLIIRTPLGGKTASEFLSIVYGYLLLLFEHTYDNVLKMRYEMLWNLLAVVTSEKCRRIPILGHFSTESLKDDYQCGLCDICSKDLIFPEIRKPPPGVSTNDEAEHRLEQIYSEDPESFNLDVLRSLIDEFRDYPTAKYRQARSVIQGSPNNLSALFVAREFSPPEELEGNARRMLRTANECRHNLADVQDLYNTSPDSLKADILVSILNDAYSTCDTVEGWEFLVSEASRLSHDERTAAATMQESLEFFLVVSKVFPEEMPEVKQKTRELEAAFYGRD